MAAAAGRRNGRQQQQQQFFILYNFTQFYTFLHNFNSQFTAFFCKAHTFHILIFRTSHPALYRASQTFPSGQNPFARLPPFFLVRGDDTSFPLVIPRGLLVPHHLPVTSTACQCHQLRGPRVLHDVEFFAKVWISRCGRALWRSRRHWHVARATWV